MTSADAGALARQQRRALTLLAMGELLAMALWFSASAVAPELTVAWGLSATEAAWLTNSVQLGFVVGALLSAALTLSDVVSPRRLVAGSAFLGAILTASIATFVSAAPAAIALRFLTGMTLAGVYPPGMKIMAGWFRVRRGLAIGVLVGALTVGSAAPHLFRVLGGIGDWRQVLYVAAASAALGALLVLGVRQGPYQAPAAPFDPRAIGRIMRDRGVLLANSGYFGHMWELYAVWTWIAVFLAASFAADGSPWSTPELAGLLAFGTIAAGGPGAWIAGAAADRYGRTLVTSMSMVVSGACCLTAGLLFGGSAVLLVPFCLVWGFAIVADSAQFSACVTELAEQSYVGTALTLQTAIGFLLTIATIQLVPVWESAVGWRWALAPLAIGPALGTLAMLRLRALPDARKLAGGRR